MRLLQLGGGAALLAELTENSAALAASGGSARPFDGAVEQEEEAKQEEVEGQHREPEQAQEQEDKEQPPAADPSSGAAEVCNGGTRSTSSATGKTLNMHLLRNTEFLHSASNSADYVRQGRGSGNILWGVGDMEFEAQMRMLDSAGFRTGYVYRNPNLLRRQPTSMPWSGNNNSGTATDFFTTDFSCGEMSGVDDVTAATNAGAVQKAK
ncbi:unnamed protein product [Dibothriocephalus latus]|uniref:Uncharacterized protein n=1 Tax=Dibothriocephalus latus TaxID=60516 RepID=A0A3P7MYP1_DIBLA|nr:unnamed protein product [Dibothriocephalus latus]